MTFWLSPSRRKGNGASGRRTVRSRATSPDGERPTTPASWVCPRASVRMIRPAFRTSDAAVRRKPFSSMKKAVAPNG